MVERYRPRAPPKPAQTTKAKPKAAARPDFVCVPRELSTHPPIRRRGAPASAGLSAFEFVIAATCAGLARANLNAARHDYAFAVGKQAIKRERRNASKDLSFNIGGVSYQFKLAGMDGYRDGRRAFDRNADGGCFLIEVSVRGLFRAAGLSREGASIARLPITLRRLAKPIAGFPPVLRQWSKAPGGGLRLRIEGQWVPRRRYARVPWPPPTSGPIVMALYLFLFGADLRGKTSIRTDVLYKRLKIPLSRPAHASRALDRALDSVNQHLGRLNEHGILDELKLPAAFEIVPLKGGDCIRFQIGRAAPAPRKHSHPIKRSRPTQTQTPRWDDEAALLKEDEEALVEAERERERFRRSLGLADDEYLDDNEIDQSQQEERREIARRRDQEESTRAQFQAMTARLKALRR